jgi:hypothetical protein
MVGTFQRKTKLTETHQQSIEECQSIVFKKKVPKIQFKKKASDG